MNNYKSGDDVIYRSQHYKIKGLTHPPSDNRYNLCAPPGANYEDCVGVDKRDLQPNTLSSTKSSILE